MSETPLVQVENLRISFPREDGTEHEAVAGVTFSAGREKLGIVGESGSGKSLSTRALMGVLPDYARVSADRLQFRDTDLLTASPSEKRRLRGGRMGMILQDPKFSLNPVLRVGWQIVEAIRIGNPSIGRLAARNKAVDMLEAVHIRNPEQVFDLYPHQVSGGMGQRVMIAMMMAREPDILVADEPTSALDVTVRNQVLSIMEEMVTRRNAGLILISHDLKLISSFCDRVLVMYRGRIVESLPSGDLHKAQHPYTRGLIACLPSIDGPLDPLPVLKREESWAASETHHDPR